MPAKSLGFTLVELLVVVAIIVVLLALLVPAMDRAVSQAEKAKCGAHLRQQSTIARLYVTDYKGKLPPRAGPPPGVANTSNQLNHLAYPLYFRPYGVGTTKQLYICPADNGIGDASDPIPFHQRWAEIGSYWMNIYGPVQFSGSQTDIVTGPTGAWAPGLNNVKVTTLPQPHKAVVISEFTTFRARSWHDPFPDQRIGSKHPDALNYFAFLDTHVGYTETYWNVANAASFPAWYNPPSNYEYLWKPEN